MPNQAGPVTGGIGLATATPMTKMAREVSHSASVRMDATMEPVRSWRDEASVLHREDGPAQEWDNGAKVWRDGTGAPHRDDGPAYEGVGYRAWYRHGQLLREEWDDDATITIAPVEVRDRAHSGRGQLGEQEFMARQAPSRERRLKRLESLARKAARASAKAGAAIREWRDAFEAEYGHDDIPDALVEVVDYSTGDTDIITAEYIDRNSGREAP